METNAKKEYIHKKLNELYDECLKDENTFDTMMNEMFGLIERYFKECIKENNDEFDTISSVSEAIKHRDFFRMIIKEAIEWNNNTTIAELTKTHLEDNEE